MNDTHSPLEITTQSLIFKAFSIAFPVASISANLFSWALRIRIPVLSSSSSLSSSSESLLKNVDFFPFGASLSLSLSSSSDEEMEEGIASAVEPSFYASETISFVEESFVDRVGKMSAELDALVRFVRRGVESLASSTSEAASSFEVFAFALEDWDQ